MRYNTIAKTVPLAEETRTLDLSDANRTLSQLSYRPIFMNLFRVNRVAPA